jgi:hypothetical protein
MRYLQLGDSGRDVEVWQRFLAAQRCLDTTEVQFGEFNDATVAATNKFQSTYNLKVTGVCDHPAHEAAMDRGLAIIENEVPGAPQARQWLLIAAAIVLGLCLGNCVLNPPVGKEANHHALPLPRTVVPNAPPKKSCPGWFC